MTDETKLRAFFAILFFVSLSLVFASGWFAHSGPTWAAVLLGVLGAAWTAASTAAFVLVYD